MRGHHPAAHKVAHRCNTRSVTRKKLEKGKVEMGGKCSRGGTDKTAIGGTGGGGEVQKKKKPARAGNPASRRSLVRWVIMLIGIGGSDPHCSLMSLRYLSFTLYTNGHDHRKGLVDRHEICYSIVRKRTGAVRIDDYYIVSSTSLEAGWVKTKVLTCPTVELQTFSPRILSERTGLP